MMRQFFANSCSRFFSSAAFLYGISLSFLMFIVLAGHPAKSEVITIVCDNITGQSMHFKNEQVIRLKDRHDDLKIHIKIDNKSGDTRTIWSGPLNNFDVKASMVNQSKLNNFITVVQAHEALTRVYQLYYTRNIGILSEIQTKLFTKEPEVRSFFMKCKF